MTIDEKFPAYPGAYDGGGGVWANVIPADEMAALRRDAERWRWVRDRHIRTTNLHMDGTEEYVFVGYLGRARTIEEAIDARMELMK